VVGQITENAAQLDPDFHRLRRKPSQEVEDRIQRNDEEMRATSLSVVLAVMKSKSHPAFRF
jgi:hypothetical protein